MAGAQKGIVWGKNRVPISRTPVPPWVAHERYAKPKTPDDAFVHGGMCRLLQDIQFDITGGTEVWHYRGAHLAVTKEGAETAARIAADFDPDFQQMEIHFVRVRRGDTIYDRGNIEAFEIAKRERDPERRALDNRLTATQLVPDVRPGDVVEVCLTLHGAHPALKGHYAAWVGFDSAQPVLAMRHRIRYRKKRPLVLKAFNDAPAPNLAEASGIAEWTWRLEQRAKFEAEPFAPPWLIQGAVTQITDCTNWREVASLFTPLYQTAVVPPDLQQEIDGLASEYSGPAERAAEALRFVQNKLRHLSLSFGDGGFAPREIRAIWQTRFGDGKDAARLYVAIARRLGLDACPALIATSHGPILDTLLPSPGVFNHCIVRLRLDDKTYWLDPSRPAQSGPLDILVQPYTGWALPLTDGTSALEKMLPQSPAIVVHTDEVVKFGPFVGSPAELERKTSYSVWRADRLRDAIANRGLEDIGANQLKEMEEAWPSGVTANAAISVEDQPETNTLTTVESYKIANGWRRRNGDLMSFSTFDTVINRELELLPEGERKTDIHLGRRRVMRRFVRLHMPRNWTVKTWDRTMEMPGLIYRSRVRLKHKRVIVFSQLVGIKAETVPAAEAAKYNDIVRAIREGCDLTVNGLNIQGDIRPPRNVMAGWGYWAIAAIGFTAVLIGTAAFLLWH